MKIVVDDVLGLARSEQVEAIVKMTLEGHPGADALFLSVVRVKSGRWTVFIRATENSQWSVLPPENASLSMTIEEAIRASGLTHAAAGPRATLDHERPIIARRDPGRGRHAGGQQ